MHPRQASMRVLRHGILLPERCESLDESEEHWQAQRSRSVVLREVRTQQTGEEQP
jgi:hypothetical protein